MRKSPTNQATVTAAPAGFRPIVFGALVALAFTGVPVLDAWNLLPATQILDLCVICALLLLVTRLSRKTAGFAVLLLLYLTVRLAVVAFGATAPLFDALQAHKWLVYLILLCFVVGRAARTPTLGVATTKILLILAALKYTASTIAGGLGRPGLLAENNFEIALFCGLLAVTYSRLGRLRLFYLLLAILIVALSGSRSGSIIFLIAAAYILVSAPGSHGWRRLVASAVLLFLPLIPIWIFDSRTASVDSIDRVKFLSVFSSEVDSWGPVNWLFGTQPLTELSLSSCSTLSYYSALFSSQEPGSCYAVVLHAFVLRVLFDSGILGLLLAFGGLWFVLRAAKVSKPLSLCLVSIAFANSLSVSGLNNVYVVLPVIVAMLLSGTEKTSSVDSRALRQGDHRVQST